MSCLLYRMVAQQFRRMQANSQKQAVLTRQLLATALATGARTSVKAHYICRW